MRSSEWNVVEPRSGLLPDFGYSGSRMMTTEYATKHDSLSRIFESKK
jgi:hypothetical protein